ncbi:PLDc_N domain-containing protein [Streptomyces sp. For3]|uniref:PLD nuclease N-terminal domain-containing protein n=1 Tax=Streptomyces silvae TaxID=2803812 RepID=UPI001923619A|nr:PLD nuclease N-terminal domain-containing protein [Streptomyces silvae]MBL1288182.1 PLDc_N domain-containing protein [Streptomyces silvae]
MLRALIYILPLALTIFAFIDCLNTPEDEAKHLPKIAWVFIILLFWIVGPIVWLAAGKVRHAPGGGAPSEWARGRRSTWVAPDDNPDFLNSLKDGDKKNAGRTAGSTQDADRADAEARLAEREADLRRREEELKRRESGSGPEDPTPPAA